MLSGHKLLGVMWLLVSSAIKAQPFDFSELSKLKVTLKEPNYVQAQDQIKLAYYEFSDASCQDIVILYPGAGLYGNKAYQYVAQELYLKHKIGCYVFDVRGHGYSGGARGDAVSIDIVWQDVNTAINFVKSKHSSSSIHLVGHSSGAGLLINFAANLSTDLVRSYILLAPFLGPNSGAIKQLEPSKNFVKKVRTWVYWVANLVSPKLVAHVKTIFFNYPASILKNNPLIVDSYTYNMSCAVTPYEIKQLITKLNKPTVIYIGENDEQFIPKQVITYHTYNKLIIDAKIIPDNKHLSILLKAPELISGFILNFE